MFGQNEVFEVLIFTSLKIQLVLQLIFEHFIDKVQYIKSKCS